MSESGIQWFIARDGKQFGPVSEVEMQKLVELGHLKAADLLWRPGFDDWKAAPVVFAPGVIEAPRTANSGSTRADVAQGWANSAGGGPSRDPTQVKAPGTPAETVSRRGPARGRRAVIEVSRLPDEDELDPARGRGWGRALAAAAVLALVAGGGYFALNNRPRSPESARAEQPASLAVAKAGAIASSADETTALDQRFQRLPMWSLIKREFPDWYGDRLKEAARLSDDKQSEEAVTRHLVQALVTLRRQYAEQALAASNPKLRGIAEAFLGNLKVLSGRSIEACYSFIAQGELSGASVNLMQSDAHVGSVETQIAAVFDAISEGRKMPVAHNPPRKADYDVLAAELSRLGWSQADLQLFADSKALAKTSPERVCKMVQDWFTAHIAITDLEAQERLLVETLRPVVSG